MQNYKTKQVKKESNVEEDLFSYLKKINSNKHDYCSSKLSDFSRDLNKIISAFQHDKKFLRYLAEIHKQKCIKGLDESTIDKLTKDYMTCAIKRRSTGILRSYKIKPV